MSDTKASSACHKGMNVEAVVHEGVIMAHVWLAPSTFVIGIIKALRNHTKGLEALTMVVIVLSLKTASRAAWTLWAGDWVLGLLQRPAGVETKVDKICSFAPGLPLFSALRMVEDPPTTTVWVLAGWRSEQFRNTRPYSEVGVVPWKNVRSRATG